ncbi:hypothetical protein HanXRQr2_Chr03g0128591 [Helianthus annuus]|uniref:Uncharacterized protein n=1 Tax=Helianthus annuus TaxID=4232 RepID=A0A9K3JJP7_HELAN|nr:hypothetical protein HanXRQr2_Chr03g0128591 [Helianthus annuus]
MSHLGLAIRLVISSTMSFNSDTKVMDVMIRQPYTNHIELYESYRALKNIVRN